MYKDQFVLCWSIIVSLENFEAVGNYHWFIENCLLPALTFKEQPQKNGELQTPHTCTADQRLVGPSWLKLSPSRDTTDRSQQNVFGHFLNKVGDATRIRFFFLDENQSNTVMAMAISYNWLFLWDYTFYKWGYKSYKYL